MNNRQKMHSLLNHDLTRDPEDETMLTTIGTTSDHMIDYTTPYDAYTTKMPTIHDIQDAVTAAQTLLSPSGSTSDPGQTVSTSDPGQTVLIVLGVLLAILVIVCCVLACIFAKLRRKGFCTVDGKNQAMCDEECPGGGTSAQLSPKDSTSSGKSQNSRSSDKLLTK